MKRKRVIIMASVLITVLSCTGQRTQNRLDSLAASFRAQYLAYYPVKATMAGDISHNGDLTIPDSNSVLQRIRTLQNFQTDLANLHVSLLDSSEQIDYQLLTHVIRRELWQLQIQRRWLTDPSYHSGVLYHSLYGILKNSTLPITVRCEQLYERLGSFPLYTARMKQIVVPDNQLALTRAQDEITRLEQMITETIPKLAVRSPKWQDSLVARTRSVLDSLSLLLVWLEKQKTPRQLPQPVGPENYASMLMACYDIKAAPDSIWRSLTMADSIARTALRELVPGVYRKYYRRRRRLPDWPTMLDKILQRQSNQYVQDDLLEEAALEVWQAIQQFLDVKGLFPDDQRENIIIKRAAAWEENLAPMWLYCPGPFNPSSPAELLIESLPLGQNWYEQLAFLRQLNKPVLHALIAGYLVPGQWYFIQQTHKHPSPLRQTFPAPYVAEGWAMMARQILVEAGYAGYDSEYQFMVWLMEQREIACAMADYRFHSNRGDPDKMKTFLEKAGYFTESQAMDYLEDIMLNPGVYLARVWAYLTIKQLYDETRQKEKNFFNRKRFVERLTREGPVPLYTIREQIFREILTTDQIQ